MKINSLEIDNFKGIKKVTLNKLKNVIVIAGPNGSGKSTIFDAIRLLKSVYGGYNNSEVDLWFSEFQIDTNIKTSSFRNIFRDPKSQIKIRVEIALAEREKKYIVENINELLKPKVFGQVYSQIYQNPNESIATLQRTKRLTFEETLEATKKEALKIIKNRSFVGEVTISPDLKWTVTPNPILEIVFSSYLPNKIGIIDYHGPYRNYNREKLGGVSLNSLEFEQRMSQHALYNYAGKYSNIKSEMASSYIKDLIRKQAGIELGPNSIIETLKDLFKAFFPDKTFLGPQPDAHGDLSFPVQLSTGEIHDIDELSSGEKEIIYGYLRLRNNVPNNSILLLDEPELHLNPRLMHGLPDFYRKNLGESMGNQLWLITHSDAFLRETVGQVNYSSYHMKLPDTSQNNQVQKINASEDLESAVIDLVGDLAMYNPDAKVVILEGENSEFDLSMISSLFPEFVGQVNAISGGDKTKITELHQMLSKIATKGKLRMKFYTIVDKDTEGEVEKDATKLFNWDVYHIENYLIEEKYILMAMKDIILNLDKSWTIKKIQEELKICAQETLGSLVRHRLTVDINDLVVRKISIGANPNKKSFSTEIHKSLAATKTRLDSLYLELTEQIICKKEKSLNDEYSKALKNDNWKKEFKGRDIINRFVGKHLKGAKYEIFRNLIISKMSNDNYKPVGMEKILNKVLQDK